MSSFGSSCRRFGGAWPPGWAGARILRHLSWGSGSADHRPPLVTSGALVLSSPAPQRSGPSLAVVVLRTWHRHCCGEICFSLTSLWILEVVADLRSEASGGVVLGAE